MTLLRSHTLSQIDKCLKFNLPTQNLLFLYQGNLTDNKLLRMAGEFQNYIKHDYKGYVEDREKVTIRGSYSLLKLEGQKEKSINISMNRNGSFNIDGVGWSCCNAPADDWTIIRESAIISVL